MLSHGAVVARECGIPAVSQIDGATTGFNAGDVITVDGVNGVVTIVSLADYM
jgi:pyruvate,water dikinase